MPKDLDWSDYEADGAHHERNPEWGLTPETKRRILEDATAALEMFFLEIEEGETNAKIREYTPQEKAFFKEAIRDALGDSWEE